METRFIQNLEMESVADTKKKKKKEELMEQESISNFGYYGVYIDI